MFEAHSWEKSCLDFLKIEIIKSNVLQWIIYDCRLQPSVLWPTWTVLVLSVDQTWSCFLWTHFPQILIPKSWSESAFWTTLMFLNWNPKTGWSQDLGPDQGPLWLTARYKRLSPATAASQGHSEMFLMCRTVYTMHSFIKGAILSCSESTICINFILLYLGLDSYIQCLQ